MSTTKQVYKSSKKTIEQEQDERKDKGVILFTKDHVMKVDGLDNVFIVKSETNENILYTIENDQCDCPDFQRRRLLCKHCYATRYYITLKKS